MITFNKLFALLAEKEITRSELVQKAGISSGILTKMGKNQSVPVSFLEQICKALDCSIDDICEA